MDGEQIYKEFSSTMGEILVRIRDEGEKGFLQGNHAAATRFRKAVLELRSLMTSVKKTSTDYGKFVYRKRKEEKGG